MIELEVLVYDDSPEVASIVASKIDDAYVKATVHAASKRDFGDLMTLINRRRTAWREDRSEDLYFEVTAADKADVIVVDYDLLRYSDSADITGSRLSYLLRCFSKCGLIIILNQYGPNTFDMSLGRPAEDFADLHLGDRQIGNPGLWTVPFDGYRPWHWPVIPDARVNFEKCVQDVQKNIEEPVLTFLGLGDFIDWMPRRVREFVVSDGNLEDIRFSSFAINARGGVDSKDKLVPTQTARVVAARVISLLNLVILPDQNVLVDAPHLVSRFPSLICDDSSGIDSWNQLCDPSSISMGELLQDVLNEHRFPMHHWIWKPVWYWPSVNTDERVAEVRDPWSIREIDWVFCEDISRFMPREVTDGFRADVSPPFNKRFVFRRRSSKARKYLSKVGSGGPQDPVDVDYVPQAAFGL